MMNKKLLIAAMSTVLISTWGLTTATYAAPTNPNAIENSCKNNPENKSWCQDEDNADVVIVIEDDEEAASGDDAVPGDEATDEETVDEVAPVTAEEIATLEIIVIQSLTAEDIASLEPMAVSGFSAEQIAQLSIIAVQGFTALQIPYLSIEAVSGFSLEQLLYMSTEAKAAFSVEQRLSMVVFVLPSTPSATVEEPPVDEATDETGDDAEASEAPETEEAADETGDDAEASEAPETDEAADETGDDAEAGEAPETTDEATDETGDDAEASEEPETDEAADETGDDAEASEEPETDEATDETGDDTEASEEPETTDEAADETGDDAEASEEPETTDEATDETGDDAEAGEEPADDGIDENTETLPDLEGAVAVNAEGEAVETNASFEGGIVDETGAAQDVVSLDDEVEVVGVINVDENDPALEAVKDEATGQVGSVHIVVYAAYWGLDADENTAPLYFMLDTEGNVLPWVSSDGAGQPDVADLVAFKEDVEFNSTQKVPMYKGHFMLPGILHIQFGYRLQDGTVLTNAQPLDITITEAEATEPQTTSDDEAQLSPEAEPTSEATP